MFLFRQSIPDGNDPGYSAKLAAPAERTNALVFSSMARQQGKNLVQPPDSAVQSRQATG